MPKKLDRCVEKLKAKGKSEESAFAICNKAMKDASFSVQFSDKAGYDEKSRTVVSVRDGIQKYTGEEIGLEPPDRVVYIYRAPETIREFAGEMSGLPITDDHVPLDTMPADIIGKIIDARILDDVDPMTNTTIKVQNGIELDREIENRELSLGYHADLIPCELYDFEQVGIVPHHLAVVEKGRCGTMCTFTDKETETMNKKLDAFKALRLDSFKEFSDAEGLINMQQVQKLVADLPEVVKTLPLKELQKLAQLLTKAMTAATAEIAEEAATAGDPPPGEPPAGDPPREPTSELEDQGEEAAKAEEEKKAMADAQAVKDREFSDAVETETVKRNKEYATVVAKAKDFLPDTYAFGDKCANDIMRDALATHHKDKFEDSELPTAFKVLKKTATYDNFGEPEAGSLKELEDKEL